MRRTVIVAVGSARGDGAAVVVVEDLRGGPAVVDRIAVCAPLAQPDAVAVAVAGELHGDVRERALCRSPLGGEALRRDAEHERADEESPRQPHQDHGGGFGTTHSVLEPDDLAQVVRSGAVVDHLHGDLCSRTGSGSA